MLFSPFTDIQHREHLPANLGLLVFTRSFIIRGQNVLQGRNIILNCYAMPSELHRQNKWKERDRYWGCEKLRIGMRLGKFPQATVNLLDCLVAAVWHEQYVDEGPRVATCVLSHWFPSHLLPFKLDGLHKFLINYKSHNVYCSNCTVAISRKQRKMTHSLSSKPTQY